jgi:hypothetical protein
MFKKIIISLVLIFCINAESIYAQVAAGDSLALVELYDSTDGDNWYNNNNWNSGPVSTWHGVYISAGRVRSLQLQSNNLNGPIPSSIGNLSNLKWLYLDGNQLSGSIPSSIGNLSNLMLLDLIDNQITGAIPPEIGNLSSLMWLALNNNQLTGAIPPEIGNLSNLSSLILYNNQLTGAIPPEIGNLSNLEGLYLYDNELTDLPDLSLTSLEVLNSLQIQNNKFTFEDIEPNIGVSSNEFVYSPQDSVGESKDTIINTGSNFTMSVSVGGENNLYQWKKDGTVIPDATDTSYTIISAEPGDAGSYICEITNTVATGLTLYSRPVTVTVPYITITSPNGGENWQVDSTYDITWASVVTSGNVRIGYSINNGHSWIQEATSTPDDGSYSWTIPNTPSDSCFVRVKNWSGSPSDISNSVFRISPSAAVPPAKLPEVYSFGVKGITVDNHFELRYTLPEKAECILEVYDMKGTKIKELSEESPAGFYSRKIDMSGEPAGVYFIRMEANGKKFSKINKVVLVK